VIARLHILARNVWWSWNPRAQAIFRELSPLVWEASNHNPIAVLAQCSNTELRAHMGDKEFLDRLLSVLHDFEPYMHPKSTALGKSVGKHKSVKVAYFCAEFGVHESLPFYS